MSDLEQWLAEEGPGSVYVDEVPEFQALERSGLQSHSDRYVDERRARASWLSDPLFAASAIRADPTRDLGARPCSFPPTVGPGTRPGP
jgi:hypothetical protein